VDKIRQRLTTFGLRVYHVDLVWTRWTGEERGEGEEHELRRVRILPAPLVVDLTSVSLSPVTAGILPVGSVRLEQVTTRLTSDDLRGLTVPGQAYVNGCGIYAQSGHTPPSVLGLTPGEQIGAQAPSPDRIPQPYEFFYEVSEDLTGTGATQPSQRMKYRLFSQPFRRPGKFDWTVVLEKISEDRDREGHSKYGPDP
jgi:hypothetical protein